METIYVVGSQLSIKESLIIVLDADRSSCMPTVLILIVQLELQKL